MRSEPFKTNLALPVQCKAISFVAHVCHALSFPSQMFAKALRLAKELRGGSEDDPAVQQSRPGAYFYSPASREWEKIRI